MKAWFRTVGERIVDILVRRGYSRDDIPKFIGAVIFVSAFMYVVTYHEHIFGVAVTTALAIVWGAIAVVMVILAGLSVFRALSVVGAGVALSVIIFLSEAYCAIPPEYQTADDALRILLTFALVYAVIQFLSALWKELFGNPKEKQEGLITILYDAQGKTASYIAIGIYLAGIGAFLSMLIQVAVPILSNQCFM